MNDDKDLHLSLIELQRLLLPATLPSIGCTEAAAAYRPHNDNLHVGGDWFDIIDRPESNSVVAIIGDVVGHGLQQIGVMGQLRSAANALALTVPEPEDIMTGLDKFAALVPGAMMATVAVVVLDGSFHARICSAGHPPPIRIRPSGQTEIVGAGRRPPLTIPQTVADDASFLFDTGDLLVMYTDGVVEQPGRPIDESIADLGAFVAARRDDPCATIATAIVDEFASTAIDDQAVLVLRSVHDRQTMQRVYPATESTIV